MKEVNKICFRGREDYEKMYQGNELLYYIPLEPEFTGLTFTALEDSTVILEQNGTWTETDDYETKLNNGSWTAYTIGTTINLSSGDKVSFRGNKGSTAQSSSKFKQFVMTGKIAASGNINSLLRKEGFENITSLSGFGNYTFFGLFRNCESLTIAPELPATTLADWCYNSMFDGCTSLVNAPELPASTLKEHCYQYMFYGCTSLTVAPELPATTLARFCYHNMFNGCTSLTQAPELPATTLATSCYSYMFSGCSSLTQAPELPATTLATSCYNYMFQNCSSLTQAPELPATTLTDWCYNSMFYGCTSLTVAPELPATKLVTSCYSYMFYGCTSLTSVTVYATEWTVLQWLYNVAASGDFYNLGNADIPIDSPSGIPVGWTEHKPLQPIETPLTFESIEEDNTVKLTQQQGGGGTWTETDDYEYKIDSGSWQTYTIGQEISLSQGSKVSFRGNKGSTSQTNYIFKQFIITGNNVKVSGNINSLLQKEGFEDITDLTPYGNYTFRRLFWNCASITSAPLLPATILTTDCYANMFQGCTSLTSAPELPAINLAQACYYYMFSRCTSLTSAPELPATTLTISCYHSMFYGCSSLTTSPELPASTLVDGCYFHMFYSCSSLNKVTTYATSWNISYTTYWLTDVSSTGDFYNLGGADIPTRSSDGIPQGWTEHTSL